MRHMIFGESHGPAIGVTLTGVPAGCMLDMDWINAEMARRAPGKSALSTTRREPDAVRILSGVFRGRTTGSPLCAVIQNTNTRSGDYAGIRVLARPGHADYTGRIRYDGCNDYRGGGHFSGRLTAPLVFAGAVAKQLLGAQGITILAHIRDMAGIADRELDLAEPDIQALQAAAHRNPAVLDMAKGEAMSRAVAAVKDTGDSAGGSIECVILGLPAGLGGPDIDENAEGIIARQMFAIPALKGIEFGAGFRLAGMKGSTANDRFYTAQDGSVRTRTNNNGGINGGITNGMPVVFSVVFKPTSSISLPQETINMETGEPAVLTIEGRHDPCIVPRAVPVVEAAAALAACDLIGL